MSHENDTTISLSLEHTLLYQQKVKEYIDYEIWIKIPTLSPLQEKVACSTAPASEPILQVG